MLGFIGAMADEVAGMIAKLENAEEKSYGGLRFVKGSFRGKECVVVQAGIGKVNAAMCAQLLIDHYPVSGVVNTGIAGSLSCDIKIGDIVLCTDAVQHDMDASAFGDPLGQVPGLPYFSFPADDGLRRLAAELAAKHLPSIGIHEGRVLTGDQFISSKEKKDFLTKTFHGMCCEMEGAAIAHVCCLNKVPFLILRAISDSADDDAVTDYPAFEQQAIQNSVRLSLALIEAFEA